MMRTRTSYLTILLLALIVLVAPLPALGQGPLAETYTSSSGSLSLAYPGGWVLTDFDGWISLTNDPMIMVAEVLPSGTVGVVVIEPAMLSLLVGDSEAPTVDDVTAATIRLLGPGYEDFELLATEEIRVADRPAIRVGARSSRADGALLLIDFGDGTIVVAAAMTAPGELDQIEETFLAIAGSIDYAPAWRALLRGHSDYVKAVAFSPDGTRIASASHDGTARLWDVATGETLAILESTGHWVQAVAFSPDGALLASGGMRGFDGAVWVWDAVTGQPLAELVQAGYVTSIAFSPDGALIATGAENDSAIHLWAVGAWQETAALAGHSDWIQTVAFSPDGARLASASVDGTARVWDVATGAAALTLEHPASVSGVAFSPDGAWIVTGCEDGSVRVWDAARGEPVAELAGHSDTVTSVAFSPDGALIASASYDKSVRVWTLDGTWQEQAVLKGHADWIRSVAFSPDGLLLVSGSDDESVMVWDVPR